MTSGKPLTEREQIHILRWAGKKTWGQIADELVDLHPDRVRRYPKYLSKWYNQYQRKIKPIQVLVTDSIVKEIKEFRIDEITLSFLLISAIHSYSSLKLKD